MLISGTSSVGVVGVVDPVATATGPIRNQVAVTEAFTERCASLPDASSGKRSIRANDLDRDASVGCLLNERGPSTSDPFATSSPAESSVFCGVRVSLGLDHHEDGALVGVIVRHTHIIHNPVSHRN